MARLNGFLFPRSATGTASLLPPPPWHYSGDLLTIEYRTDPAAVAELLPDPLEPPGADEEPGAVAFVVADWQSCSESFDEVVDPVRSQYKEAFFVVRCRYRGQLWSRCVYIWVDKDFALARGHLQGYPKKLGSVHLTRPVTVGRAGPRLEPGGRFGATVAANDRRLAQARFTITGPSEGAGFVNALPMLHHRWMPRIETEGGDSLAEIVTMRGTDVELGPAYRGDASLELFESPTEELTRLAPAEMLGAYWRSVGTTFPGGTTLEG